MIKFNNFYDPLLVSVFVWILSMKFLCKWSNTETMGGAGSTHSKVIPNEEYALIKYHSFGVLE